MHDVAFVFFAGLALVLLPLPLPLQWRARNTSAILNLSWLWVNTLVSFINTLLWWDTYEVFGHVWCDISVKISIGFFTGLAASSLGVNRRLARIASSRSVTQGQAHKRRETYIDLALGLGLPAMVMAISYIFQPHRFNIMEGVGCELILWQCVGSILLVWMWPIVLSVISAVYGIYAARFFFISHAQFRTVLRSSQSGLSSSHYFRLIGLASADVVFGLPAEIYFLVVAAQNALPWGSWKAVHYNWSRVVSYSAEQVLPSSAHSTRHFLPRWVSVVMCYVAFLFLGVGDDAVAQYSQWLRPVTKLLFRSEPSPLTRAGPDLKLGSTVQHPTGSTWSSPDTMTAAEQFGPSLAEGHTNSGLAVSVTVERDVV